MDRYHTLLAYRLLGMLVIGFFTTSALWSLYQGLAATLGITTSTLNGLLVAVVCFIGSYRQRKYDVRL